MLSAIMVLFLVSGCNEALVKKESEEYIKADLIVTTDFGRETVLMESISTNTGTVLDFLKENTEVATSSQGKFVESINKIGGKK